MKKSALRSLVFFLFIFVNHAKISSQNYDPNTRLILSNRNVPAVENSTNERALKAAACSGGIRDLTETNQSPPIGDAYPYLSQDGLRLYFSQGLGGGSTNIFYASRSSTNDPFGASQQLNLLPAGSFATWLSNDELEIWYSGNGLLGHSFRTTTLSSFSTHSMVTMIGAGINFVLGPSLTPDNQEMFVWANTSSNTLTAIYTKTGPLTYSLTGAISYPIGFGVYPGQLSKNGLSYYVSLDSSGVIRFYKLTRPNTASAFSNLTRLPTVLHSSPWNMQPTVSGNEAIMAWARCSVFDWSALDLFITCDNILGIDDKTVNANGIQLFPNPNNGHFQLKSDKQIVNGDFVLFNTLGEKVYEKQIATENTIDVSRLSPGLYPYLFKQNKGGTYSGKLLIE